VTGAGFGVGVVAEICAMLVFPRLSRRLPLRAMFAVAFLGSAVRWVLLSRAGWGPAIVALQAAHFLTFGIFWACSMEAMADAVPGPLRATGQALFTAVVFGVGNGIGYALSGWGYDRLGGAGPLYAFAAGAEVVAFGILLAARRRPATT
jgi:PPP family 3-phenylpropionic acid transporter